MLNQRLLAALLAVTTFGTTVAVNISPSYGQVDDAAKGAANCLRNCSRAIRGAVRSGGRILEGAAGSLGGAMLYDRVKPQSQPQPQLQPQQPRTRNRYITPENAQKVFDYHNRNR